MTLSRDAAPLLTRYDDANSTRLKAEMARSLGLGGVGSFTGENVGPLSNGWSAAYWQALKTFKVIGTTLAKTDDDDLSPRSTVAMAVVTVHNNSGCCCGNIYPRSAANLVSSVNQCASNCAKDPLCHAAIMITGEGTPDPAGQVRSQCQLKAAPQPGMACCIHKPHMDQLSSGVAGGLTVIDMGTSSGGRDCPCKNHG
jgi:hypothetical protein